MKKFTILLSLFLPLLLNAQTEELKLADQHYHNGDNTKAKAFYLLYPNHLSKYQKHNLARIYQGEGKAGLDSALAWYERAAKEQHWDAMITLYKLLPQRRTFKDSSMAYYWLANAANLGHLDAINDLAYMFYAGGQLVSKDLNNAKYWWTKGAEKGNTLSQRNLAALYIEEKNYTEAVKWWSLADDPTAKFNVANYYKNGIGVKRNPDSAIYYYYKALEHGLKGNSLKTIKDSLLTLRHAYSYPMGPANYLQTAIDQMVNGFPQTKGAQTEPILLPKLKELGGQGRESDGLNNTIRYYQYKAGLMYPFSYIRHSSSSTVEADKNTWVYSGLLTHSQSDPAEAERIFDHFLVALKKDFPAFSFSAKQRTEVGGRLRCSVSGAGVRMGKELFIDLKLKKHDAGLYHVEVVVKDRRYKRVD